MDMPILQKSKKEKNKIVVSDAIRIDDKIWFMSDTYNGLFCMDIASEKIELMETFPNELYTQRFLYSYMERVGDKIYFAPYFAREVAVYDTKKHSFEKIKIDEEMLQRRLGEELFIGIQKYNNFLFFIPAYSKAIIRLNLENHEIQYITEWSERIGENYDKNNIFFWKQKVLRGNNLFIPFYNMNAILEFNCDSLDCEIRKLDVDETGYSGACEVGKNIWLYTRQAGNLLGWNPENNEITRVDIYDEGVKTAWDSVAGIISYNNRIMIFGAFASQRKMNEKVNLAVINKVGYTFAKEEEDYIIFCERDTSMLSIIDKKSEAVCTMEISTEDRIINIKKILEEEGVFMEKKEFVLEDFLIELKNDNL